MRPQRDARPARPRPWTTKESEKKLSTILEAPIQAFLEEAETSGTVDEGALEALALEHELDDEELAALRAELEAREVEILAAEPAPEPEAAAAQPVEEPFAT